MKSPKELSDTLARQWQSADHRELRLLTKTNWPIKLPIGKPAGSLLQKSPNTVREHIKSWRDEKIGIVQWQKQKFQSATLPINIPTHWIISSPSEWIRASRNKQVELDYHWLSEVISFVNPIYHKLLVRQSSIWKRSKDNMIQCAELAMKLSPGMAEGKPIRSICINNIDTKFIENNSNLLTKLLNIRYNNTIKDNNLESFLNSSNNNEHWLIVLPMDDNLLPFKQLRLTTSELEHTNLPGSHLLIIENEQCRYQLPERLEQTIVVLGAGLDLNWLNNPSFKSKTIAYWGDIDSWGFRMLSMAKSALPELTSLMMDLDTYKLFEDKAVKETESSIYLLKDKLNDKEISLYNKLISRDSKIRLEQEFIDLNYKPEL